MRLGQNACLGNCLDEFDNSGERSRAIMALLLCDLHDGEKRKLMSKSQIPSLVGVSGAGVYDPITKLWDYWMLYIGVVHVSVYYFDLVTNLSF
jgi:hypothetical protein